MSAPLFRSGSRDYSIMASKSTSVPVDLPNRLTITDLPKIFQLLSRHRYLAGVSYYDLGLYLGLYPATLDVIAMNNKEYIESCLCECLTKWLQKADYVQETGVPSIYSLVSALMELGENGVADGIDMEVHPACRILAHYTSNQSLLSALPQLGIYLYVSELIKEMTLPQGDALLAQVKEAVCKDYTKLETFAKVLCKSAATVEIGYSIMREYREYGSGDENALKIYLPMNVTSELTMIRLKLWNTLSKVESIMMNNHQSPSLPNIKYVLGTHYITLWPQLARCQNINDILQLVCANSSLDDISLLEYLVNVFNIEEAKPVIEEYKEDVEELKMKLRQFLEEQLLKASPLLKCVTIVVDEDTIGSVLNDVQRLSSDVLLPLHVRLHVIRDGASVWKVWKRKSFTGTFDELTAQKFKSEIKKIKNESETFQKQRKALLLENERLMSLPKDNNVPRVHNNYYVLLIVPVQEKEEYEILQEKETVHTCTYIKKDDISKLSVILEPVEDDWYHIGQCLEVKESVLTEIKEMKTVDSRLTYVLESWCIEEDRTINELKDSLKRMDRDDILEVTAGLHELPTGQYTMNNDEEDINAKDSNEVETETENKEIQTTQLTLDKEIQFNYLVPSQDNLEGLSESQIAGKKLFLVQGDKPQLMNWEEYGLRISLPEDSLSPSETVEVSVLALVGGDFKFPDNTRLVSAVYAISTNPPLLKSLRIEMQHCIDLSDPSLCKYLKFAVAPVHTASLPYQFSIIEGGEFPPYQRYGSIERSKFCCITALGVEEENGGGSNEESDRQHDDEDSGDEGKDQTGREGQGVGRQEGAGGVGAEHQQQKEDKEQSEDGQKQEEKSKQENNSGGKSGHQQVTVCTESAELSSHSTIVVPTHSTGVREATVYAGQVFYERADKMRFTAARDLNALHQYIKQTYSIHEMDEDFTFKLNPSLKYIQLIFDGPQLKPITGWSVSPHKNPCLIRERDILGFGDISTTVPPSCLVSIYAENNPDTVPNLSYSVPLKGVQEPMEIIINRSLRNMSSSPSAAPEVVNDDTNLGVCAQNALKKHHDKLKSLLSRSEPIFRDIAGACKVVTIINSTEYDKIFDDKTGQSLLERADHFINCIMTVVDVCPDQLGVFLNIVMNKGNIAFVRVAELISQSFNSEVPQHWCIKLNKQ